MTIHDAHAPIPYAVRLAGWARNDPGHAEARAAYLACQASGANESACHTAYDTVLARRGLLDPTKVHPATPPPTSVTRDLHLRVASGALTFNQARAHLGIGALPAPDMHDSFHPGLYTPPAKKAVRAPSQDAMRLSAIATTQGVITQVCTACGVHLALTGGTICPACLHRLKTRQGTTPGVVCMTCTRCGQYITPPGHTICHGCQADQRAALAASLAAPMIPARTAAQRGTSADLPDDFEEPPGTANSITGRADPPLRDFHPWRVPPWRGAALDAQTRLAICFLCGVVVMSVIFALAVATIAVLLR